MEPWNNGTLEAPQGRRGTGCRTLLPPCPARPGGPHPEGTRTNPRPDRHWEQEGQPRASPTSPAPGRAIQLLRPPSQRGPDLRSHPALLPLSRTLLSQPAPLASPPPAAGRNRLAANYRSEEHTSELQSLTNLVCRLLLEKKKENKVIIHE